MRRVALQMSEELGREPTDDELSEEIGIASGKKFRNLRPLQLALLRSMHQLVTMT